MMTLSGAVASFGGEHAQPIEHQGGPTPIAHGPDVMEHQQIGDREAQIRRQVAIQ